MHKALTRSVTQVIALFFMTSWMLTVASAQSPAGRASKPLEGGWELKPPGETLFPGVDPPPNPRAPNPETGPSPSPMPKALDYLKPTPDAGEQMPIDLKKYPIVDPPPKTRRFMFEGSSGTMAKP